MPKYFLRNSPKKNKRFMIITPTNKRIYFGSPSPPSQTYLEHKDDDKKDAWISRHSKLNENWERSGADTGAGFWSRWLLWNSTNMEDAIKYIRKRFGIHVINET